MGLINSVLTWYFKQRIDQIDKFIENPEEIQNELFFDLVKKAKNTQWGKKYGYGNLKSIEEFKNRVPVQDYDSTKPFIEKIMKGQQNVLWPSEIKWFAKSSGTTSDKSKFIPVSSEALEECHYKAGKDLLAIYCNLNPDTDIFSGKCLVMGGSTQVNKLSDNSFYGDVSAVMMKNMPWLAQVIKTPDLSVALMDDWEKKIDKIAEETMNKNVTHIAGVPTWTVVLIRRLFEMTGKDNLRDIWPNLELYIHGGVSFTPYREQFKQMIRGENMYYLETYNASEGFFGIQDSLTDPQMLLMLDYGVFFEFMPMSELDKDNPKTLQLGEVKTGENYAVIISTNAGLWRYMIGDTITFTSTFPFRIQVSGRTKFFINAFGEEVIVDNAERALTEACRHTGANISDYTAGPVFFNGNDKGGHEWIIEFDKQPDDFDKFVEILDKTLQSVNSDYEAKRTGDMALKKPLVHNAPQGLFYEWLKSKGKLGGQNKVPRLSNDRKYLDEIVGFMKMAE